MKRTKTIVITLVTVIACLLSLPAAAAPTTGQLLELIENQQKQIEALQAQSHMTGLVSVSKDVERCTGNEYGLDCEEDDYIMAAIHEGQELVLEINTEEWIQVGGEPVLVTETFQVTANKLGQAPVDPNVPETVKDFVIVTTIKQGENEYTFELSPASPIYHVKYDDPTYVGPMEDFIAYLLNDSQFVLVAKNTTYVKDIRSESIGAIASAFIQPYRVSDNEVTLEVEIGNYGDLKSDYITTVTDTDPMVAVVLAQSCTLEPYEIKTLYFTLTRPDTFDTNDSCKVTLKSNTGRIYDTVATLDFPDPDPDTGQEPLYIPDFDGDADVDIIDFSEFATYWLYGT